MMQSLKTEPRIKREIGCIFLQSTRVEMASRKIQTYQNKAKNLCTIYFVFDMNGNENSLKQNIIVIKEICSWLPPF